MLVFLHDAGLLVEPFLALDSQKHCFTLVEEEFLTVRGTPYPCILTGVIVGGFEKIGLGDKNFVCEVEIDDHALLISGLDASV